MDTPTTKSQIASPFARLISHLRIPLYRNGYALALSSAATSGIGVLYWVIAAHEYPTEVIGLNSAAISAMMFLAGVSELNLISALIRFIPTAGHATRRLVIYAYLLSLVVAAIIATTFILRLHFWAPGLSFLGSNPLFIVWFVSATMAWCIFVLQDGVLTGLRQATWVPIENTAFSLAKIVLVVIFATSIPELGVFASWTLALIVSILPTNIVIFRHLIPRHIRGADEKAQATAPMQIVKFAAADYLGSLFWLVSTTLLPVLVTTIAGARANAFFYLSWTIAYSLYTVSPNMGSSLIVEASTDQDMLGHYSYKVFIQTSRLVVPLAAAIAVGAPYLLQIFGSDYAANGASLLRLLALSAIPNVVNALFISIARVQRRMLALLAALGTLCTLVLVLSYIFLHLYGIIGVGMAWLISQSLVAATLWITQLRRLWSSHRAPALFPSAPEKHLGESMRILGMVWGHMLVAIHKIMVNLHLFPLFKQLRQSWRKRRQLAQVSQVIPDILENIPPLTGTSQPITWTHHQLIHTINDITVITLGPLKESHAAVLKLPQIEHSRMTFHHRVGTLGTLHADPRLDEWSHLIPTLLATGEIAGQSYTVEQILPGVQAQYLLSNRVARKRMLKAAVPAIRELHRRTARQVIVDEQLLSGWIDEPLCLVQNVMSRLPRSDKWQRAIAGLAMELNRALVGKELSISWIHGDFAPSNILVTPDGSELKGIVDWEQARPDGPPVLDLLQLLFSTRMVIRRQEMGKVVQEFLQEVKWTSDERALFSAIQEEMGETTASLRALVLLCWLQHVAAKLMKSAHYANHWLWLIENIEPVLQNL